MTIKTGAIKAGGSEVYPHTALDQIRKSAASSTTLIAQGGVIQKNYLDLTGLISSSYVSSANIIPASAINGLSTAVNNAASTYVHSSGVIPTSAVVDLPYISSSYAIFAEDGWTEYVSAGAGIDVTSSGDFPVRDYTIALKDYDTIETATTGATVTIAPGKAYKIDVTASSKTLAISSFDAGLWGRESHLEIFVANTGYIKTGAGVVLAQSLEPDSVNNCTVRFHDGKAIISVEDHIAGYIVVSSSGVASGSLPYALASATSQYIAFNASLSHIPLDMRGVVTNGLKHVVGDGYEETVLTGGVSCTSRATFVNLSMSNCTLLGGSASLSDVYVPEGAFVSRGGGVLALGKVFGAGTIDVGGSHYVMTDGESAYVSGCSVVNLFNINSNTNGGLFQARAGNHIHFEDCVITGATVTRGGLVFYNNTTAANPCIIELTRCTLSGMKAQAGGVAQMNTVGSAVVSGCVFSGNNSPDFDVRTSATLYIKDCEFFGGYQNGAGWKINSAGAKVIIDGSNTIGKGDTAAVSGNIIISSGASITLKTYISAGVTSGIEVKTGGCVVNGVPIAAGFYTKITGSGGSAITQ